MLIDDNLELNISDLWCPELERVNFAIFSPDVFSGDLPLKKAILRRENSRREYPRCSLKMFLEDKSAGKSLSIKQFDYDWSPPAYDCPSLWKNYIKYRDVEAPEPRPFLMGNDVLWIGVNYRNQRAASITRERTTIELVVIEGDFSDQELIQIIEGLSSLNTKQKSRILAKDYAKLSYGYPHAIMAVNVPISFWKFPVSDSGITLQTAYCADEIPEEAMAAHLPLPYNSEYKLNSVFVYHGEKIPSKDSRYHFIYEHEKYKGSTIQLLHVHRDSPAACSFPPIPDTTQKFQYKNENIFDIDCHYAYRSEKYGPHELIFQYEEFIYLMIVKPTSWTTKGWFFNFVKQFFSQVKG